MSPEPTEGHAPARPRPRCHPPPEIRADPGDRRGIDRRRVLVLRDEGRLGDGRPPSRRRGRWRLRWWRRTQPGTWTFRRGRTVADFQTSCVICHSARLPLSQPPFPREKWVEVVHKMVDAYGAPMTPEEESHVVDYLLAARPPGP